MERSHRTYTIFLNQEAPFAIYASMTEMNFPYSACSDLESIQKSMWLSAKVVCEGSRSAEVDDFLRKLHDHIHISGAMGSATGRNIHQKPLDEATRMCNAIYAVAIEDATV